MSKLRKIFLLTSVAAAVSLSACGGSDAPSPTAPVLADVPAITISAATAAAAKGIATALIAAPAITLPAIVPKSGPAIPAGTTLKFTALPAGSPPTALSGFTLTSGGVSATGVLSAGSCIFTVQASGGDVFPVGTVIVIDPCSLDLNTAGVSTNTQSIAVSFTFGGNVFGASLPVEVTVINGVPTVTVNGEPFATGAVVVTGS